METEKLIRKIERIEIKSLMLAPKTLPKEAQELWEDGFLRAIRMCKDVVRYGR